MHNKLDQIRDKEPERKEMHKKSGKKRYEQEERRYYINVRSNLKIQKKLYETFDTDTGFDLICSSCLQYKNME